MVTQHNQNEHARYRLVEEIIALSEAKTWTEAKYEWSLGEVFFAEADCPGICICGHTPILENCIIVNRKNGNRAIVGIACVSRFIGIDVGKIFSSLRRVRQKETRALNSHAVEHAHKCGWINDWERQFYLDILRRNRLSPRQFQTRVAINRKVMQQVTPAPPDPWA